MTVYAASTGVTVMGWAAAAFFIAATVLVVVVIKVVLSKDDTDDQAELVRHIQQRIGEIVHNELPPSIWLELDGFFAELPGGVGLPSPGGPDPHEPESTSS